MAPVIQGMGSIFTETVMAQNQPAPYRRILLVVGESQDTHRHAKLSQVLRDAQLANIAIYTIGPSSTAGDLRYGKGETPGERPSPCSGLRQWAGNRFGGAASVRRREQGPKGLTPEGVSYITRIGGALGWSSR
jgi:hypothetical protein